MFSLKSICDRLYAYLCTPPLDHRCFKIGSWTCDKQPFTTYVKTLVYFRDVCCSFVVDAKCNAVIDLSRHCPQAMVSRYLNWGFLAGAIYSGMEVAAKILKDVDILKSVRLWTLQQKGGGAMLERQNFPRIRGLNSEYYGYWCTGRSKYGGYEHKVT